jgi:hypothetical protein
MKEAARMRIDCYLAPGCSSEDVLRGNITQAIEQTGAQIEVVFHRIDDQKAETLKLTGSPSVFINEKELQPLGSVGFS